ncbi:MAG: hypothetical protein K8R46_14300 [Pirellulales bacterium]|nr:hypothetical protein [Pirellulales bacterium]
MIRRFSVLGQPAAVACPPRIHGRLNKFALAVAALCSVVCCGCGPSRPEIASVSGKVTYQGKPIASGRIGFHPEDGRRPAMAAIEPDGCYKLTTFDSKDGALLGKHRVTIKSTRTVGGLPLDGFNRDAKAAPASLPKLEWLVPEKYSQKDTTPLTAEVEEGENTIDFDL